MGRRDGTLDIDANRSELKTQSGIPIDSYATLLVGRERLDGTAVPASTAIDNADQPRPRSRHAGHRTTITRAEQSDGPPANQSSPDLAAQLKFFDYPWAIAQRTAFGTPPDLSGRYGVRPRLRSGQPYYEVVNDSEQSAYEVAYDVNPNDRNCPFTAHRFALRAGFEPLATRDDASAIARIDEHSQYATHLPTSLGQNDDAPFATADLERVLRAFDADSGTLPSRLWDVVDAFDPSS